VVTITPAAGDTSGKSATAQATVDLTAGSPTQGQVTAITLATVGSGYTSAPAVSIAPPTTTGTTATATATLYSSLTEVGMVPAVAGTDNFPATWTVQVPGQPGDILDARTGGVPDPAKLGPSIIQIGTEGGFLAAPAVWTNIPQGFDRDPKSITVGNMKEHNLLLGPAERADVLVDFSGFAGKTLILYNDAPAAVPAPDARLDYYTNNLDLTAIGGHLPTLPGYGPNTRTILQIKVAATTPAPAYDLAALQAAFASTATTQGIFAKAQDPILVPQAGYNAAYNATFPTGTTAYERIQSTSLSFNPMDLTQANKLSPTALTITNKPKCIQELFENAYGRMNATLGVEIPFTNGQNQTTIPYGYIDPPITFVNDNVTPLTPAAGDGTQIWKITHNGVDTHAMHFHLFDVQLINRVDWAGVVKPPELNELGWKETVRMNPLEDCIVALRPVAPKIPFGVFDSKRLLNPMMPAGDTSGFSNIDTNGNPIVPPVTNVVTNFGWEYVWHCHVLSHEEMDMMRPVVFSVARSLPAAPVLTATGILGTAVSLSWTDATPPTPVFPAAGHNWGNPGNEVGFRIERAENGGAFAPLATALANATAFTDSTIQFSRRYSYRVIAFNAAGDSISNVAIPALAPGAPLNVAAVAGNAQATVSFTPPASNGGSPITSYTVTSSPDAANPSGVTATGTASPITVTGLTNGTTYTFTVTATNAAGTGPASIASNAMTPIAPPGPPLAVTAVAGNAQATVSFTPPASNGGSPITSYTATSSPGGITATGAAGPITVTGLTNGTTYTFTVAATNAAGTGPASSPSNAVTPIALPGPPLAVTAVAGNAQAAVSFTPPASNGGSPITSYTATSSPGGITATGAAGPITVTGLTNGTTYTFTVAATNAAGTGPASIASNAVTPQVAPAAPTSLTANLVAGPRVSLTWLDNATTETGFVVERANGTGVFATLATVGPRTRTGGVTYTDTTVTADGAYTYRVKAVNGTVSSAYSNTVAVSVPTLPAAPSGLSATAVRAGGSDTVTLRWTDNATNEASFTIQRSTSAAFTINVVTINNVVANSTSYVQTGVPSRTTYYYHVRAVNVSGVSAWSNAASVTTP